MKKVTVLILALAMGVLAGTAFAADRNNNFVLGDDRIGVPGGDGDPTARGEIVPFPLSSDTWDVYFFPYWWNIGDTVYGERDLDMGCVTHATIYLYVAESVLNNGGHVDLDLRLDGTTVGSVVITEFMVPGVVVADFDFPAMTPPFEVRYYETNTVDPGRGSIVLNETDGYIDFGGGPSATEHTTWGGVKGLYR